ncbi:hypothetical protein D3C87_486500 [compost metagenome]
MRIFAFLFFLVFINGCSTRTISYDREKILKKYSTDYKIFVDDENLDLSTVYLDKNNIKTVLIDKKKKELKINQISKVDLFDLKNLNLDSLSSGRRGWDKKKIVLLIINGKVIPDSLKIKTKLDPNAIKSFEIISEEKLNNLTFCRRIDGDFLVIKTK